RQDAPAPEDSRRDPARDSARHPRRRRLNQALPATRRSLVLAREPGGNFGGGMEPDDVAPRLERIRLAPAPPVDPQLVPEQAVRPKQEAAPALVVALVPQNRPVAYA